jgi:hypothetical protein
MDTSLWESCRTAASSTGEVLPDVCSVTHGCVQRNAGPAESVPEDLLRSSCSERLRYAVKTDPNRAESRRDDSVVGAIVGAIRGGEVRGRTVKIARDSVISFRLERPFDVGVPDRGVMRDGRHYHDYYRDRDDERGRDRDRPDR